MVALNCKFLVKNAFIQVSGNIYFKLFLHDCFEMVTNLISVHISEVFLQCK